MSHSSIIFNQVTFQIDRENLFGPFNTQVYPKNHILIIGENGSGKSTLLNLIKGIKTPTSGNIKGVSDVHIAWVDQVINDYDELSGGQRFNKALSQAIAQQPDILCLDEPTNHLDEKNKRSLLRMLKRYKGTLFVISHDSELMGLSFDEIWHIKNSVITTFKGSYADYCVQQEKDQQAQSDAYSRLQSEQKKVKKSMQKEQVRAAKSKHAHRNENDRTILGAMKERGSQTQGKKNKLIDQSREKIKNELSAIHIVKDIKNRFNIKSDKLLHKKPMITIVDGSCGYRESVLENINLVIYGKSRVGILGANGSGKSTFLKAIMHNNKVYTKGQWLIPSLNNIGYLDQHYTVLNPEKTAEEMISIVGQSLSNQEVQKLLHDFLFITPALRSRNINVMSGGEKARLAIACIAAQSPPVLLLDEITNNIDLRVKEYIISVLNQYSGTIIAVSHDKQFMKQIGVTDFYSIDNKSLSACLEE